MIGYRSCEYAAASRLEKPWDDRANEPKDNRD